MQRPKLGPSPVAGLRSSPVTREATAPRPRRRECSLARAAEKFGLRRPARPCGAFGGRPGCAGDRPTAVSLPHSFEQLTADAKGSLVRGTVSATRESLRRVLLRINDGEAVDELIAFLRRRECSVRRVADDTIEVEAHPTLAAAKARMELDLLLRVWHETHPQVRLEEIHV
jgi:hypothetical protein